MIICCWLIAYRNGRKWYIAYNAGHLVEIMWVACHQPPCKPCSHFRYDGEKSGVTTFTSDTDGTKLPPHEYMNTGRLNKAPQRTALQEVSVGTLARIHTPWQLGYNK